MRAIVVFVTVALLGTSGWLWYEVRDAHNSWSSASVTANQSRLDEARRVEEMLRDDRIVDALSYLQRNRDVFVLQLASTRSAIDRGSWRWYRNEHTLEQATSALRDEFDYRRTVGNLDSAISEQVQSALDEFEPQVP